MFEYLKKRGCSLTLNNDEFLKSHNSNEEDKNQDEGSYKCYKGIMFSWAKPNSNFGSN